MRRTAALWAGLVLPAAAASLVVAPGLPGAFGAGLASLAVAIAIADARSFLIPDPLSGSAALLGLARIILEFGAPDLPEALLRAAATVGAFLLVRIAYRRLRGRQGLGLGDVKLAAVAGIWLDWTAIPVAVEIAAAAALLAVGLRAALGGPRPQAVDRLPFGLFFAPAIWLCWALGPRLAAVFSGAV